MESNSSLEKRSVEDAQPKPHVASQEVDVAAELAAGTDFVLDPEEAARVRYVFSSRDRYPEGAHDEREREPTDGRSTGT